jgi:hypothetical protein
VASHPAEPSASPSGGGPTCRGGAPGARTCLGRSRPAGARRGGGAPPGGAGRRGGRAQTGRRVKKGWRVGPHVGVSGDGELEIAVGIWRVEDG